MRAIFEKVLLAVRRPVINLKNLDVKVVTRPVHFLCEGNSSKIGFLFPPKIHDVGPLTRILQGSNPSVSQLNTIVPLRRFSATAEGDESRLQGTPASIPDVPERIKFKRPDKTARNIMNILDREAVEEVKTTRELPDIKPGYIVQLKVEVPENKRRVSIVKGIVIARRNAGLNTTIRLRRLVAGVGVESLFPLYSPNLKEIKVLEKKKVRRAKLYYLRDKMNALKKN